MGYTHYWEGTPIAHHKELERIRHVIDNCGIPLQFESDIASPPKIDAELIRFNGVGDDGCETFYIEPGKKIGFAFCKTERLPYDAVVVAVLIILAEGHDGFVWRSDGTEEDHAAGIALANDSLEVVRIWAHNC